MSIDKIGCCGAYCGTCPAFLQTCKGCKIGYDNAKRDLSKAKCKIKVCCLNHHNQSCADCSEYISCNTLNNFYNKSSYKYKKYKQATAFIKMNGYDEFFKIADLWKNASGKY